MSVDFMLIISVSLSHCSNGNKLTELFHLLPVSFIKKAIIDFACLLIRPCSLPTGTTENRKKIQVYGFRIIFRFTKMKI